MRNPNNDFKLYHKYGALALFLTLILGGCAINRPVDQLAEGCKLPSEVIEVAIAPGGGQQGVAAASAPDGVIEKALRNVAQARLASAGLAPSTVNNLVLSGGGQHGSFGSGFLKGMQTASALPRYDIVSGVSTGALQATFALLGQELAPDDRKLDLANDFPADANARPRTNLDDLVSGYTISREKTLYNEKGVIGIIRGAAKGNLAPLAKRLDLLITPKTLEAVKHANDVDNRKLLVALLNYESGKVEIIDMTALAARYNGSNFALIQHCYNQVLIAASSEPIGAPPVVIDGKLYFDAGLRYGVFLRRYSAGINRFMNSQPAFRASARSSILPALRTDIIVNGDLAIGAENTKFSKKFSALTVAGRGRKILVDQIYRFSVAEITNTKSTDHVIRLATIRLGETPPNMPAPKVTFDPAYMKEMIKLGKTRGAAGDWQSRDEVMAIQ
jgi:predicted acylesterase/phospholipase RssA